VKTEPNNPFTPKRVTDMDGLSRPQGAGFSIGAYEAPASGKPAQPK
jgi:hypothetical protein